MNMTENEHLNCRCVWCDHCEKHIADCDGNMIEEWFPVREFDANLCEECLDGYEAKCEECEKTFPMKMLDEKLNRFGQHESYICIGCEIEESA